MTALAPPKPSTFGIFKRRDFTLLWTAQLVSTAGSGLTDLAAGIFVWRATGSALAVGLTLMITAVPTLVVGLLAGVFVDRHDRQRIMMWSCLVQAVVVGLIAVVVGIEAIALPGLFVLLLLNAGVKQFFDPAHDSLIPEIASDEELAAANSFLSIASFGSTAVGFAAAGLLAGSVGLVWAFVIDAATFLFAALCISLMNRHPMPVPEDEANVAVIMQNLRTGVRTVFQIPMIRSLFIVGSFSFFSIGLWNVLLLPFSLVELGASEFEYGLQEGLTSVGFVIGSFFMARFSRKLAEPVWIIVATAGMGAASLVYGLISNIGIAILLVMVSGFFNAPSYVARSVLMQRNIPRDVRGRVFSAYYVMRDVIYVAGMAAAGLADVFGIRVLIVISGLLLFVSALVAVFAPGLNRASWKASEERLRDAEALPAAIARAATPADLDLLAGRLPAFGLLSRGQRTAFLDHASVRDVPAGTRIVEHGDVASSAFFVLEGEATAGVPVDDGYRGLSTMAAGDWFGEIAALTGSTRTADVVAAVDSELLEVTPEALRTAMAVPEIQRLVLSTMTARLQRTEMGDLPRLAGADQQALRDLRTRRPAEEPAG